MQVLLVLWLVLAGMRAGYWDSLETESSAAPADATQVVAAEGPANPPPKP